jgi:hypothetical protein
MNLLDEKLAEYLRLHPDLAVETVRELIWLSQAGQDEQAEA